MEPSKKVPSRLGLQSVSGLSLLEMSLGMMILAVLSVGVSCLIKSGVESQLAQQVHLDTQTVGMNIVDDLRQDIRTADKAVVSNGGNTLVLTMQSGNTLTYQLDASKNFTRKDTNKGAVKTYNDPAGFTSRMQVTCPSGCFQAALLNHDTVPLPRQILVNEMRVEQVLPNGTKGTSIDRAFGPANFTLRQFSFEVMSATEFQ